MKKILVFLLLFLIGLGLFSWITKTVGWEGIRNAFLVFSGFKGIVIVGLTILMFIIAAWKWKVILKSQGYSISLKELGSFVFAAFSILFFTPMLIFGREIFRTYVLKEKKSIPWQKAMASVIIDRILEWTFNLVIILVGVIFFILKIGLLSPKLVIILIGLLLVLVAGALFFYLKSFRKESIVQLFIKPTKKNRFLEIETEVFKFFKPQKIAMWQSFAITFLRSSVAILRCWLVILFLGKGLALLPTLSILGFYFLVLVIPIPAALGSHDALQAFTFNAMGLGANMGTAFAIIIRGAELIAALIGAVILLRLGLELLRTVLFRKISHFFNSIGNPKIKE